MNEIKELVRQKMHIEVKSWYTIGNDDHGLEPASEEELQKILLRDQDNIEKAITDMYEAYKEDNTLEELEQGVENDAYREFLFDHVRIVYTEYKDMIYNAICAELKRLYMEEGKTLTDKDLKEKEEDIEDATMCMYSKLEENNIENARNLNKDDIRLLVKYHIIN